MLANGANTRFNAISPGSPQNLQKQGDIRGTSSLNQLLAPKLFPVGAAGLHVANAIRAFVQAAEEAAHMAEGAGLPWGSFGRAHVNKRQLAAPQFHRNQASSH